MTGPEIAWAVALGFVSAAAYIALTTVVWSLVVGWVRSRNP